MEIGEKDGLGLVTQMDPGRIGLTVLADVFHQAPLHKGMAAVLKRGLFFIKIALVTIYILDLPKGDLVIIFVDKPVTEESQDHEIRKVFKVQGIHFPDEVQRQILGEQVFQLMIEITGKDGVVVQVLKKAVHKLEQF